MKYYPNLNKYDLFTNTYSGSILKTDIKQKGDLYELNMEMPGIKKEDIQIELNQGYLKITLPTETKKIEETKQMISID